MSLNLDFQGKTSFASPMVVDWHVKLEDGGGVKMNVGLPLAHSPRVGIVLLARCIFGLGGLCGGKIGRTNIKVQDHESSCPINQEASSCLGLVRPDVSQNTRMQENAKLERQHFKLQSSLKIERQEKVMGF